MEGLGSQPLMCAIMFSLLMSFIKRFFVRLEIVSTHVGTNLFDLSGALLFLLFLLKVSLREPPMANLSSRTVVFESILMLLMFVMFCYFTKRSKLQ